MAARILGRGLTLPITGLQQPAKRAVAIAVDWRVRPRVINRKTIHVFEA